MTGEEIRIMNETQRFFIIFTIAGIVSAFIFPPNDYCQQTYTFVWNVPKGNINLEDTTVQLVTFAALPSNIALKLPSKYITR
jgi:hypothetical protein